MRTRAASIVFSVWVCVLAEAQCPLAEHGKVESFARVIDVQSEGGPAGIELALVEDDKHLTATLRDYEGSPNPLETKLRGTIEGCDIALSGKNVRGRVEIRGRLAVATFEGTIRREIGKTWHSERVSLKRRIQETDRDAVAVFPEPFLIERLPSAEALG